MKKQSICVSSASGSEVRRLRGRSGILPAPWCSHQLRNGRCVALCSSCWASEGCAGSGRTFAFTSRDSACINSSRMLSGSTAFELTAGPGPSLTCPAAARHRPRHTTSCRPLRQRPSPSTSKRFRAPTSSVLLPFMFSMWDWCASKTTLLPCIVSLLIAAINLLSRWHHTCLVRMNSML